MSSRFIVTGSNGQLGRSLKDHSIFIKEDTEFCTREELDLTCLETIRNTIKKYKPEVIINTAAYTNVRKAETERDEVFAVNSEGAKNLAYLCKKENIFLIHISTDYVFDGFSNKPYDENDNVNPLNNYGKSKLSGEKEIQMSGCKYVILRTSWLFSEFGQNFVTNFLRLAQDQDNFKFVSDQFGSPTSCLGLTLVIDEICKKIVEKKFFQQGVFHYSGEPYVSWYDFVKEIYDQAKRNGIIERELNIEKVSTSQYDDPVKRPKNSALSNNKLKTLLSLQADDWLYSLSKTIENFNKLQ